MHAASRVHCSADAPGLARVRAWRMHAEVLRDSAEAPALTTGQRTALLRDAVVAERQADADGRSERSAARACLPARDVKTINQ